METKIKASLAVCFFLISMVIVGTVSYEVAQQDGYKEGYMQADQDWMGYLDEYWGPYIDMVYRKGYSNGYLDGYFSGWMDAREVERVPP